MEKYYRMVIELYKEAVSTGDKNINHDRIMTVATELAKAITTAKVKNEPTNELEALMSDVEFIKK